MLMQVLSNETTFVLSLIMKLVSFHPVEFNLINIIATVYFRFAFHEMNCGLFSHNYGHFFKTVI